ncbi:MAG: metallophosphoesterase [Nitrosomonas sp.]|nr:metallophosphoesterase [Nitrosomonas sp.]
MPTTRENFGHIVGLLFYLAIASTLFSFTTNLFASGKHNQDIKHNANAVSFAVIGDGPYGDEKEVAFNRMIDAINKDHEIEFVIHVGDIKSGGTECTDERLQRRFDQLQQIRTALVYTPGDNEWTDCHRANNGGWYPLERLTFIRQLFFPNPGMTTGQKPRPVLSQTTLPGFEPFVENVLFMTGRIVVSTIHVVGSNNNLRPWSGIDASDSVANPRQDRIAEFNERNAASLEWLERTFEWAMSHNAAGVLIAMQADPNLQLPADDPERAGFNAFLEKLFALSLEYDRPVVLAHGDSHVFRVDRPRLLPWYANADATGPDDNPQVPKLTRLEVFGDSELHWVKVTVDPRSQEVFNFAPQLVPGNF